MVGDSGELVKVVTELVRTTTEGFTALKERLNNSIQEREKRDEDRDQMIAKFHEILLGNGKAGMLIRLDRLEQSQQRTEYVRTVLIGAVAAVVSALITGLVLPHLK
jgi:hypothetical protein